MHPGIGFITGPNQPGLHGALHPISQLLQGLLTQFVHPVAVENILHQLVGSGTPSAHAPIPAPPAPHIDSGYNPAVYQRAIGNTAQAAADWEAHHPYAMAHHNLPGWLRNYLAARMQDRLSAPPPPPAPAPAPHPTATAI